MEMVLEAALQRSSILIITGGLGPTTDDLTREAVSSVMSAPLLLHSPSLQRIEDRFKSFGRVMTENNKKQAYLPKDSMPIENNWGTAPGFILDQGNTIIIALPGVPKEMKGMMEETVLPYLEKRAGSGMTLYSKVLKVYGVGESTTETRLKDLLDGQTSPTIALLASRHEVKIRLSMKAKEEKEAKEAFQRLEDRIEERLGDSLYARNGEAMEEIVMRLFKEKGLTLSLAESITGGLVSHQLTNTPGASAIFKGSWVTYTEETKGLLGLTNKDLRAGAVSPIASLALAQRARELCSSSIGAAVTGIAGPTTEEDKPVGLVYTALSYEGGDEVKRALFLGDREEIKERAALYLLDQLRRLLLAFH